VQACFQQANDVRNLSGAQAGKDACAPSNKAALNFNPPLLEWEGVSN